LSKDEKRFVEGRMGQTLVIARFIRAIQFIPKLDRPDPSLRSGPADDEKGIG
jgi:hypothetical protein